MRDESNAAVSGWMPEISLLSLPPTVALAPIDSFDLYQSFAGACCASIAADPDDALVLCVDSATARDIEEVRHLAEQASRCVVLGQAPEDWGTVRGLEAIEAPKSAGSQDFILAAHSKGLSVAVLGAREQRFKTPFRGGWTLQRECVELILRRVLEGSGKPVALVAPDTPSLIAGTAQATRIVAAFAQCLSEIPTPVDLGRNDLFSVLGILKAISSKRRAHDVLFVFVEMIARAVPMDRCSVVRILAGESVGRVLASHDDESVNGLEIDLSKYPELCRAMQLYDKVVINSAADDPITRPFERALTRAGFTAIAVVPIVLFDPHVGSLLLRVARRDAPFTPREISFCEIVAEAAANALQRADLFDRIQHANERLERLATTDGLTGLYNHRSFRERLHTEFERARRYHLPLSLILFDIDNFKRINDVYGHVQGDSILCEIAQRTLRTTRKSDFVARYGGEEFAVIMPHTGVDGAWAEAERIRADLSGEPYKGLPAGERVTVSLGVATLDQETMLDTESLIRAADTALYDAKGSGKDRTCPAPKQESHLE